jgi:TolB protein
VATKADVNLGISGVNPKFSPDGTLITYQNGGVYVVNSDGTNNRLLAATGGVPSFDPTGTMILYSNNGIWRINVDGTGRTQLLASVGIAATYSPDGTQIAYNASAGGSQQLFIMNADGTSAHQALTTSGSILDTVWRPSSKILFGMGGLYSYDPSTPAIAPTQLAAGGFEPSWSPDATHISWTNGTTGKAAGIWIMNADGSGQTGPVIVKGRQGSWGP